MTGSAQQRPGVAIPGAACAGGCDALPGDVVVPDKGIASARAGDWGWGAVAPGEAALTQPVASPPGPVDLLVIGGGVNGCGVARDAAGRGLSVTLVEQDDLASWTSSASTKLVHGGLRYLEHYAFRLVRESLQERERLLQLAPHLITPLRFVLPHEPGLRPAWMIRLGLLIYDHLGGRSSMPKGRGLRLSGSQEGAPLQPRLTRGFSYFDCRVDDSRLVALNAVDAAQRGARILTRTQLVSARRVGALWEAQLRDAFGRERLVRARMLVNAAGPWVSAVLGGRLGVKGPERLRLVKGSHIAVPSLYEGDHAYLFQNGDGRIVFAIPWRQGLTLIGTTDTPFDGDPATADISADEIAYLCASASEYFRQPVRAEQVVASFAGVRPLYDDAAQNASAVTRDYVLALDVFGGEPPVLSVFGGKITTYRRLAEHALEKLSPWLPHAGPAWTGAAPLPGGDLASALADATDNGRHKPPGAAALLPAFIAHRRRRYAWAPAALVERLAHAYGARMDAILAGASQPDDLGEHFGAGLYAAEVTYLMRVEWARCADDVLWRRTRLGLALDAAERGRLAQWMAENTDMPGAC